MATLLCHNWRLIAEGVSSNSSFTFRHRVYGYQDNEGQGTCTVHLQYRVYLTSSAYSTYSGTWGNGGDIRTYDAQNGEVVRRGAFAATFNTNTEYTICDWTVNVYENEGITTVAEAWTNYAWAGSSWNTRASGNWQAFTAPKGLSVSNIVPGIDNVKATVSVTGWGGGGSSDPSTRRYRELQVRTYSASGLATPRRYQPQYGNSLSGTITTTNSSNGDLTITGNTQYVIGAYAATKSSAFAGEGSEAWASTGSQRFGTTVTLPPAPSFSTNTIGVTDYKVNYSVVADGGYYTKYLEYSLDKGSTWKQAVSITGGSAKTGTFTISGLSAKTAYTIWTRVRTSAGTTAGNSLAITTLDPVPSGITLSVVNTSATSTGERQIITWRVSSWGETATSGTARLYASTDKKTWTQIASKTDNNSSTYTYTGLKSNTKYYYKISATNNLNKTTESSVVELVTQPSTGTQTHSQSYKDYETVNWNVTVNYKGGELPATISYRLYYNNAYTGWVTIASSVNPSSATDYKSSTIQLPTDLDYNCEVRVVTSVATVTSTQPNSTLATHQGPTNVDFTIVDGNTSLQNWLNTFSGYDGLIRVNGKSQTGVKLTTANYGTYSDSATFAEVTARLGVDSLTKTWSSKSTANQYFGNPTPTKFNNDLGFGTDTVRLTFTDSLGATTTVEKDYTVACYEEPTINGSAERLNLQGNLLVRIYGTYTRLWLGNQVNQGQDCNAIKFEYRVVNYDGSVKQDWAEITKFVTEVDPYRTFLKNYEGTVTLADVDFLNSFTVEVRITDHFGSYEGVVPVDVWDADRVLYPPEYDVELWDWKTNTFVADISYLISGDLSIEWTLNDVEQVSFDIDLEQFEEKCADMNVDSTELLRPYSHDIRIRRNGNYILGCQLVEANVQVNNDPPSKIRIKGTGFLNLFKDQYIMNEQWGSYTYSEIAKRLVVEAQQPDCLVQNPTCDIDVGYWLAGQGTVSYDTNAYSGDGCLVSRSTDGNVIVGTEVDCKSGESIVVDVWVKGNKGGSLQVSERLYITQSTNEVIFGNYRLSGEWQHLVVPFTSTFDNLYITFSSASGLYIDECYVYARDDSSVFSNLGVKLGEDTATEVQSKTRQVDYSLQNVKDAIMELTSMEEDNFDFDFTYDRKFNVYARKGQDRTGLEISYPGNVYSMSVARSAASLYNKVTNIGSGVGDERMQVVVNNMDSQQKYGTRELVATNSNVSLEETLIGQAVGTLYDSKDPTDLPTITIKDGSVNPSNIGVGDTIIPTVDSDAFLSTIEGLYRVAKLSLTVEENGVESVKLTIQPEVERPAKKTIRYIRDYINGNTVNASSHWVQVEALVLVGNEYVNIAQGATVTSSSAGSNGYSDTSVITNGNLNSGDFFAIGGAGAITVDLGADYPVDYIKVWHYYADNRRYKSNTCSVGSSLPTSKTADLETVLWKTTSQTRNYSLPNAPYVETGSGRKSEWLQANAVKGEITEKSKIRYIKDVFERPTYLTASGTSGELEFIAISQIEALMRDENGNWVNKASGRGVTLYADGSTRKSSIPTNGEFALGSWESQALSSGSRGSITLDLGAEYPIEYIRIWHFSGSQQYVDSSAIATNETLSVGKTLPKVGDLKTIVWEKQNVIEGASGLCTPNLQGLLPPETVSTASQSDGGHETGSGFGEDPPDEPIVVPPVL